MRETDRGKHICLCVERWREEKQRESGATANCKHAVDLKLLFGRDLPPWRVKNVLRLRTCLFGIQSMRLRQQQRPVFDQ